MCGNRMNVNISSLSYDPVFKIPFSQSFCLSFMNRLLRMHANEIICLVSLFPRGVYVQENRSISEENRYPNVTLFQLDFPFSLTSSFSIFLSFITFCLIYLYTYKKFNIKVGSSIYDNIQSKQYIISRRRFFSSCFINIDHTAINK